MVTHVAVGDIRVTVGQAGIVDAVGARVSSAATFATVNSRRLEGIWFDNF
jgi:hypothetical protein